MKINRSISIIYAIAIFCVIQAPNLHSAKLTTLLTSTLKTIKVTAKKKRVLKKANKIVENGLKLDAMIKQLKHPLPFDSAEEAEHKYIELWNEEVALKEERNEPKSMHKQNMQEKISRHQSNILFYCQRLFRYIVKNDIKNQYVYTIDLGMTIDSAGDLKMARRPLDANEKFRQNTLLLILCTSKNKDAIQIAKQELRELHEKRTNPSQCADSFFPTITLVINESEDLSDVGGYYKVHSNTIYIPEKRLRIKHLREILHEFGHCKQQAQAGALSGLEYVTFMDIYKNFPHTLRVEIDADIQSVKYYPHPDHLLKLLKKRIQKKNYIENFPYLSPLSLYGAVLELRGIKKNTNLATDTIKSYKNIKNSGKKNVAQCDEAIKNKNEKSQYQNCFVLIKENNKNISNFLLHLNEKVVKTGLVAETDVSFGCTRMNGCKEYYTKKCEILGIKHEDNKLENSNNNNILK